MLPGTGSSLPAGKTHSKSAAFLQRLHHLPPHRPQKKQQTRNSVPPPCPRLLALGEGRRTEGVLLRGGAPVRSRGTHRPHSGPRRHQAGSGRSPSRGRKCHRSDSCRRSCSSSRRCLGDKLQGATGEHEVTGRKTTLGPEAPPGTLRWSSERDTQAAAPRHRPQAGWEATTAPSPSELRLPHQPLRGAEGQSPRLRPHRQGHPCSGAAGPGSCFQTPSSHQRAVRPGHTTLPPGHGTTGPPASLSSLDTLIVLAGPRLTPVTGRRRAPLRPRASQHLQQGLAEQAVSRY